MYYFLHNYPLFLNHKNKPPNYLEVVCLEVKVMLFLDRKHFPIKNHRHNYSQQTRKFLILLLLLFQVLQHLLALDRDRYLKVYHLVQWRMIKYPQRHLCSDQRHQISSLKRITLFLQGSPDLPSTNKLLQVFKETFYWSLIEALTK